jgi:hypothetical protein
MNLVKTNEHIEKSYSSDANNKETILSTSYDVTDGTNNLGNVSITPTGFNMNVYSIPNSTISDLESKITDFFTNLLTVK